MPGARAHISRDWSRAPARSPIAARSAGCPAARATGAAAGRGQPGGPGQSGSWAGPGPEGARTPRAGPIRAMANNTLRAGYAKLAERSGKPEDIIHRHKFATRRTVCDSLWLWRAGSRAVVRGERRRAPSLSRSATRFQTHVGSIEGPSSFMRTHFHVWSVDRAHGSRLSTAGVALLTARTGPCDSALSGCANGAVVSQKSVKTCGGGR